MLDKKIFIKNLEDFKDTEKYSPRQLAEFLSINPVTSAFYKKHIEEFRAYLKKYTRTIFKYSKEHSDYLHLSYTAEERKIIGYIQEKHLADFWIIDLIKDGLEVLNCSGIKLRFAIYIYDRKNRIPDLIDYVIKFCIMPYSENKKKIDIELTGAEEDFLKEILKGGTIKKIAQRMNKSPETLNSQKDSIVEKFNKLNIEEYKNLKPLEKIKKLAELYF